MRALTTRTIKDTAAVKVITVVTLIYLPTTTVLVRLSHEASLRLARADHL